MNEWMSLFIILIPGLHGMFYSYKLMKKEKINAMVGFIFTLFIWYAVCGFVMCLTFLS